MKVRFGLDRSSNAAVKRPLTRLHLELMRIRRGAEEEKVTPEELPELEGLDEG